MSNKRSCVWTFDPELLFSDPCREFTKAQIADMHYVFGLCDGDARKAALEYKQRFPRRVAPNFRLFTEIHRRLRKHGVRQVEGPRFSNMQVADMHFVYGFCDGDAKAAANEYKRRYPTRVAPNHADFTKIYQKVRGHKTKGLEEAFLDMKEDEKAKMRSFFKNSFKNPSLQKTMLGLGMHPDLMCEIFKKGKPNLQLLRSLRTMKKLGLTPSFRESDVSEDSDNESVEDTEFEDE